MEFQNIDIKNEPLGYLKDQDEAYEPSETQDQPKSCTEETQAMVASDVDIKDEPLTYLEHQEAAQETFPKLQPEDDFEEPFVQSPSPTHSDYPDVKSQAEEIPLSDSDIEIIEEENYFVNCLHCSEKFPSLTILNEHYKSHHFCKLCKESFTDDRYFYTHILNKHISFNAVPVSCEFCNEEIIGNDILKHVKQHAFGYIKIDSKVNEIKRIVEKKRKLEEKKPEQCEKCFLIIDSLDGHQCCELCYQCNAGFPTETELNDHIKSKHFKRNVCDICKINVNEILNLAEHVKTCLIPIAKPQPRIFKCKLCNSEYKSREQLEAHTSVNHFASGKCGICCMRLSEITECSVHLAGCLLVQEKYPYNIYPYYCFVCQSIWKSKTILRAHIMQSHMTRFRDSTCKICHIDVCKLRDVTEHFKLCSLSRQAEEPKPANEVPCDKNLKILDSKKTKTPSLKVKQTIKKTKTPSLKVKQTIKKIKTPSLKVKQNKIHACSKCLKELPSAGELILHQKMFSACRVIPSDSQFGPKPVNDTPWDDDEYEDYLPKRKKQVSKKAANDQCLETFINKKELLIKETKPSILKVKKIFVCPKCSKELQSDAQLRLHQKINPACREIAEKPTQILKKMYHSCLYCSMKFGTDALLEKHVKIDHECYHCGDIFKYREELIQHLVSINVKSMTCQFCNKFISFDFTEHIEMHSSVNYTKCKKCNVTYMKKSKHFYDSICFPPSPFEFVNTTIKVEME